MQTPRIFTPAAAPQRIQAGVSFIDICDPATAQIAVEAIHRQPVLIQLPSVFALLAAPTAAGAQQLDACKSRLEGKNYGTAIGSLQRFVAQAQQALLPAAFHTAAQFAGLEGAFIRLPFRNASFHSPVIRNGQHQGLLLGGVYRRLFSAIEQSFAACPPEAIWDGRNYTAPLATSCNISGHPEGSIVTLEKAAAFARERGLPFLITTRAKAKETGSYPVLGFERNGICIHREGPGLAGLLAKAGMAGDR